MNYKIKSDIAVFFRHNFGSISALAAWGFNAGIYLTIAGLFTSRFLISCGMIVMGCASLLYMTTLSKKAIKEIYRAGKPVLFAVILLVASVLSSFAGSEETGFAVIRLKLYAGFLLIPLVVFFSPPVSRAHLKNYFLYALCGAVFTSILIQIIYYREFEVLSSRMRMGQPLPTPVPHIRYGMFVCFAFLGGIYALLNRLFEGKWFLFVLTSTLYLGISILLLSVRTAWMITFAGMILIFLRFTIGKGKKILIIPILLLLVSVFTGAYFLIPSVRFKTDYMRYDWHRYRSGEGSSYSDSERVYSLQNGWQIWEANKWFGVGSGDLHTELKKNSVRNGIPTDQIPHNQFLVTAACGGILSLVLFIMAWILLFREPRHRKVFIFNLVITLYLLTFLFEPTFETSLGVLSFVFITSMILIPVYRRDETA